MTTATYTKSMGGAFSLEDLRAIAKTIRDAPPVVNAIWFVNRQAQYNMLRNMSVVEVVAGVGERLTGGFSGLSSNYYGIAVFVFDGDVDNLPENEVIAPKEYGNAFNFRRQAQIADDVTIWPWFVKEDGVWAEWSNGTSEKLDW